MKSKINQCSFHIMDREDLKQALQWAAEEGWNPGKWDTQAYHETDKSGFLMLKINNEPAGCISLVRYSKDFAFIGLFIIREKYRNQGFGKILWEHAIKTLDEQKISTIGLYAVPQQTINYNKWSRFQDNFQLFRFNKNPNPALKQSDQDDTDNIKCSFNQSSNLKFFWKKISVYDETNLGVNRKTFIKNIIQQQNAFAIITFNANSEVSGYGIIRPCIEGYRLGPCYANTFEDAKKITEYCYSHLNSSDNILCDVPAINPFAKIFAEYFGLIPITKSDTLAMFRGDIPEKWIDGNKQSYGLASLELG